VDPKGAYLYVADQGTSQGTTGGSSNIASFSISSSTGFPAAVTDSPFASESESSFVVLDPTGPYLFVGNQASNAGVQAFGVSAGSLNTIASYSVGNTPSSIVILQ
jgi:6-phosphogluconolactonase (cycloisomerase 2 family)